MKLSHVLAAVAILGLAGGVAMAKGHKGGNKGHKAAPALHGKVVSVSGADVTVKTGHKKHKTEVVVATDASTVVTINGASGKVADLKARMAVIVSPKTGTATKIVAKNAVAHKGHKKGAKNAAAHKGGKKGR